MDKPDLSLEWGIAAILDPRQKLLGKFHHMLDPMYGVRWLHSRVAYWDNHDEFVKEFTNQTISYALDLVDPAMKSKWPMKSADQAAFAESKMGHMKQL